MEYYGYRKGPLEEYSMSELIDEIEYRKSRVNNRAEVNKALEDISKHADNAEVINEVDNLVKKIYTIEVRYERYGKC